MKELLEGAIGWALALGALALYGFNPWMLALAAGSVLVGYAIHRARG